MVVEDTFMISLPEAFAIPPQKCLESCVTSHDPWFLQQCHCLSSSFEKSLIIRKKNIKAPEKQDSKIKIVSSKLKNRDFVDLNEK